MGAKFVYFIQITKTVNRVSVSVARLFDLKPEVQANCLTKLKTQLLNLSTTEKYNYLIECAIECTNIHGLI